MTLRTPSPICSSCGSAAVVKEKYGFRCTRCGLQGKAAKFHQHFPGVENSERTSGDYRHPVRLSDEERD